MKGLFPGNEVLPHSPRHLWLLHGQALALVPSHGRLNMTVFDLGILLTRPLALETALYHESWPCLDPADFPRGSTESYVMHVCLKAC